MQKNTNTLEIGIILEDVPTTLAIHHIDSNKSHEKRAGWQSADQG